MGDMKSLTDHLAQYASYHRDHRNVWTHVLGIPLIVLAIATALSRWVIWEGVLPGAAGHEASVSMAALASVLMSLYYLRLDLRYGLVMTLVLTMACLMAHGLVSMAAPAWWVTALGLFVVGWVFQFLGHYYEGRKPAFLDDLVGLLIGPLFVVAELGFMLGMRPEVEASVVNRSGHLR